MLPCFFGDAETQARLARRNYIVEAGRAATLVELLAVLIQFVQQIVVCGQGIPIPDHLKIDGRYAR